MVSILEDSLANTVYNATKGLFMDAVLARDGAPSGPEFDPTPGTEGLYSCKAIHEEYSERDRLAGIVQVGERKIMVLAKSISIVPARGDRIVIRGRKFVVVEVTTDPAQAVWVCKARA